MSIIRTVRLNPDLKNSKEAINVAEANLSSMSISLKLSKVAKRTLEINQIIHLAENKSSIFAVRDLNSNNLLSIAEIGANACDQINPIDYMLGRLSVRMSRVLDATGVVISGLYSDVGSSNCNKATSLLLHELVSMQPKKDAYIAVDDNDPVLDSVLNVGFKDTGIVYKTNHMNERLYVHDHNNTIGASPYVAPFELAYMIITNRRSKTHKNHVSRR